MRKIADNNFNIADRICRENFVGENGEITSSFFCFDCGDVGKQPVAWKEYCAENWFKELQESMDWFTGHHDITEMLLKTALDTLQSVNILFPEFSNGWLVVLEFNATLTAKVIL